MTSIVSEFHDAPSLKHLDELSTEIFDSPRVQVCICTRMYNEIWWLQCTSRIICSTILYSTIHVYAALYYTALYMYMQHYVYAALVYIYIQHYMQH